MLDYRLEVSGRVRQLELGTKKTRAGGVAIHSTVALPLCDSQEYSSARALGLGMYTSTKPIWRIQVDWNKENGNERRERSVYSPDGEATDVVVGGRT
uniref:Rhs family protein n=1 Tax=Angiostrongylus cantonensis TaxID=6313 RepID=A0A0K0DBE0_ANGCA